MSAIIPPVFQAPPIESIDFLQGKKPNFVWTSWFQAVAARLTQIMSGVKPPTATSPGNPGMIRYDPADPTHIYFCVAPNVWVRVTVATF
jgi:hypothetical protein